MSDNEYTFTGTVRSLSPLTEVNGYHQRSVVLTSGGRYASDLEVRFSDKSGDVAAKLDDVDVGDKITVTFDVSSRKSQGGDKWFTNANGWDVEIVKRASSSHRNPGRDRGYTGPEPFNSEPANEPPRGRAKDDIPF